MNPQKPIWIDPERRKAAENAEAKVEREAEKATMIKRSYSVAVSQPVPQKPTAPDEVDEDAKIIESIVNPQSQQSSLSQSP